MMALLVSLLVLLVGLLLGVAMHQDPGFVLIHWHHYRIESSAWIAVLAIVILFLIIHYTLKLLQAAHQFPERMHYWNATRRLKLSQKQTNIGLCALAEGRWAQAEKALIKGVAQGGNPLMNYLGAARAAQALGANDRCDAHLKKAYETTSNADLAVAMTQVQLQIKSGRLEIALSTLQYLHSAHPKHAGVVRLLQKVYQSRGDWQAIQALLPTIKRLNALDDSQYHVLSIQSEREQLNLLVAARDQAALLSHWQTLSKAMQQNEELLLAYVASLGALSMVEKANDVIEKQLKKSWISSLLNYYKPLTDNALRAQIKLANVWLKNHPDDVYLLLCLAKLHMAEHVWGSAKVHLLSLSELSPSAEVYRLLAEVHAALGDDKDALRCYQMACSLTALISVP